MEKILAPLEIEALHDNYHTNPKEALTPNEVRDIIVEWNGGIASGYHVRSIISRVYGVRSIFDRLEKMLPGIRRRFKSITTEGCQ